MREMRTWGLKRRMLGIWMALGSENLSIFFFIWEEKRTIPLEVLGWFLSEPFLFGSLVLAS